jgi:hypothetical protein
MRMASSSVDPPAPAMMSPSGSPSRQDLSTYSRWERDRANPRPVWAHTATPVGAWLCM